MGCGALFFGVLVFYGCCQKVFQICYLVGVIGWGRIIRRFGIWFLLALFGHYGGNGIDEVLRMRSEWSHSFMSYFLIHYITGPQSGATLMALLLLLS
jgi:hypothetical protein